MRANYQQLVKAHQQVPRNICNMKDGGKGRIWLNFFDKAPTVTEDLVPDETKFQVFQVSKIHRLRVQAFQVFMDSLFQSFNQQVSMHNFAELSGCVFSWIEEQCKPGDLQVIKEIGEFFAHNVVLPGPGLLNTATDREQ